MERKKAAFHTNSPLAIIVLNRQSMDQILRTGRCLSVASLICLTLCSAVLGVQPVPPGQVTLGWNASPDPTVVGYYLYYGTTTGVYTNKIDVGTNTIFAVTGLVPGSTYFFTATSRNAAGIESSYVPEASYIVPGILTVTQNPTNGIMRIRFPVAVAQSYELQSSFDLKSWSNLWLTPTQTTNGWIESDEPCTNTLSAKFYRLILY
jgi:hypothetical protein